jgi:hypothetical protein
MFSTARLTITKRIWYNTAMYLTVKEAAARLSVTQACIYIAIKDGRLKSERKFDRIVVSENEADAYGATAGVKNGYAKRTQQEE